MTVDAGPEEEKAPETDNGKSQSVENQEDSDGKDIPIMNFFKTLVSNTIGEIKSDFYEAWYFKLLSFWN